MCSKSRPLSRCVQVSGQVRPPTWRGAVHACARGLHVDSDHFLLFKGTLCHLSNCPDGVVTVPWWPECWLQELLILEIHQAIPM